MIVDDDGKRVTPTEAAKLILISNAQNATYWDEQMAVQYEKMTASERRRVNEALEKQFNRLQKMFGHQGWELA